MLDVLKSYDKSTAEGLLARTSFYLNGNPALYNARLLEGEDAIRSKIIDEICKKLKINPNLEDSKRIIDDYIDLELEKSMVVDKETEKNVLVKLSKEACLPTDLYKIKIESALDKVYHSNVETETPLIEMAVKSPDLVYNFSSSSLSNQEDISIFAKYYKMEYEYDNFFLLVIGKRKGLNFIVNQAWRIYKDIINPFSTAFNLLEIFVEKFGVEVEFQGKIAKFFSSVIAKNEKEFRIIIDDKNVKKSKGGGNEITFFHFMKPMDDDNNNYSLFFVIDLLKYRNYLKKHKYKVQ
jgi:hypothetical protein